MNDAQVKKLIADRQLWEALEWLREDEYRSYTIGEFGWVESVGMVRRGYTAGATRISVYEVYCRMDDGLLHTDRLLVELPPSADARERVLDWARSLDCEPDEDIGQKFLDLHLPAPAGASYD